MTNDPLWYKDAIIYQLHVKAFLDANGDGIGDFAGLAQKLDYLADLGVTAVWLLPFYPSPMRDDGYDIADYRDVNPAFGSIRDFRYFVREAHRRGLKVITELVINHTSDQHPWFQRSRRSRPGSTQRGYYVWSTTNQRYSGTRIIFCDTEKSNWTWDAEAKAYYWHRFFSHQPDLNFDNPRVFVEVTRVMRFWLEAGVDGLRLDAVPYLAEREGTNNENLPETHAVLRRLRQWLDDHYSDRMFLAEANQWPEDVRPYFGDGDECHMAFHFPLMPRIYMALAREDRYPITDIMRQTPDIPDNCQWAIFLRNHDELTLEMVTDRERDYLWQFYAADARARINLGIRRRLAPLLGGDRRKIELLNSLLMSMPGTPIVYYGDEIGMGDNIFLGDRNGVRTPMQWSPDRNGGFSRADPEQLYLPPIMDSIYGFEAVNVEAQLRQPASLLNWMRRLIAARKRHPALGRGELTFLYPRNRKVLAYLRSDGNETMLCVANMSAAPQAAELDLSQLKGRVPVELLGQSAFPPIGGLPYFITLPGYGFYWFLLAEETEAPKWHEPYVQPLPEFRTMVLTHGWDSIAGANSLLLQQSILPGYLANQRWFAAKGRTIERIAVADTAVLPGDGDDFLMLTLDVSLDGGEVQRYLLPLAIAWESASDDPFARLQSYTLARARTGGRIGAIHDAALAPEFARAVAVAVRDGLALPTRSGGQLVFQPTSAFPRDLPLAGIAVDRLGREQSNTSLLLGADIILKALRRLASGVHPEVEIGRFLTEVARFPNTPPLFGSVEMRDGDGVPTSLLTLQGFVRNQGDGWEFTLDHLDRLLGQLEFLPSGVDADLGELYEVYLTMAETLGRRVAELHRAFALPVDDPAFHPDPANAADVTAWGEAVLRQAQSAHAALTRALESGLGEDVAVAVRSLLDRWQSVQAAVAAVHGHDFGFVKTRVHGDLHLGQVVVVRDDFDIIDFEGEPLRSLEERRCKGSPLKDVAGMLRSFHYAASTALHRRPEVRPGGGEMLRQTLEGWRRKVVGRFLQGYRTAIGDCPSVPADDAEFHALLELFMLEKVLYEICYEAANRPDWLAIPVNGALAMLGGDGEQEEGASSDGQPLP
ncbi:MAG: maltose alpha-D-glucosyltransferase [Rhodospirillales bacterium]|nr:maltose alpha-D-glucosyltransferase [Rhodospirillales bacterium]